jgi:hypothetical protein
MKALAGADTPPRILQSLTRDKRLSVRRRFKRQPHTKLCAIGTCAEVDFSVMTFDDGSVGDDESKSRA